MVELLKQDPDFASVYLAASLEESEQPGGQQALLSALRHVAEAQGMAAVAERAGMPRESLYRALSAKGNPTISDRLNAWAHALRWWARPVSWPRQRA